MHVPQNVMAEVELRELSAVPYQIISPSTHGPIIGLVQDNLLGAYLFTNEGISFTPQQAMNLLMTNTTVNVEKLGEIIRSKKRITNFDLLSQITPPISLKYKTKGFDDDTEDVKTSNNVLEIRNGEYIRGRIDKGVITGGSKSIIQRITNDYGNKQCARFIDNLQNIITEFMKMHSFSVGISDLISNAQTTRDIVKIIDGKRTEVKDIIDQVMMGTFINNTGRTTEDEFESQVLTILSQASGDAGKIALKSLDPQNRFVTLVKAGSKGNENNIAFMTSCLGQQTVEGKRIPCGFNDRTLPHFPKYDESPAARGFVVNSYVTGLSPTDLFFHAMAGRVGLIDTAVKSVTWETPIILVENGSAVYTEIGRWIDGKLSAAYADDSQKDNVQQFAERNMELLDTTNNGLYIPTTNDDGIVTWGEITAITRHDPGEHLYEITTQGGRTVTVTESKSLIVWNEESKQFLEKPTTEICCNDYLPVTRCLPVPNFNVPLKYKLFGEKEGAVDGVTYALYGTSIVPFAQICLCNKEYVNGFIGTYLSTVGVSANANYELHIYCNNLQQMHMFIAILNRVGIYSSIHNEGYCLCINPCDLYDLTTYNRNNINMNCTSNVKTHNDVVLDKIKEINIIGVEKHPKMYDLTIPSTLNFGLANGLQVRDTSSTGYIQRRLIKGLEDAMVRYDHTVRSNKGTIIQYRYGDDSIDTIKVESQNLPLLTMSIQDIYAHYNFPDISDKIASKTLSAVFIKQAFTAFKKEAEETIKKCQEYTQQAIKYRDDIIRNVFGYRNDTGVNCPVAFQYIIGNIQGQSNINQYSLVDITPMEVFKLLEQTIADLNTLRTAPPTDLFKALYYFYLSPKDLLLIKRFNRAAIHRLLDTIKLVYKQAIVAPGEMVGPVAAQSIGQVSTQMSLAYGEKNKIIAVNKYTGAVSFQSVQIGDFCDKLIAANAAQTQNTGHVDSVETCLAHLDTDYFIVGVDAVEKTHWNRISHVSRHPVNGQMMRVTTKSGRTVETTTSHSHLVRSEATQTVVPIVGADMKEGMRIPVATHIDNPYVVETVQIGGEAYKLDHQLGWFIGAYLAKSCNSVTNNHIPDFAFIAPNDFKAGLLQGYFNETMVIEENLYAKTSSKQLNTDLALLLNYFGIFASIKNIDNDYYLNIPLKFSQQFMEKIGTTGGKILDNIVCDEFYEIDKDIDCINGLNAIISTCFKAIQLDEYIADITTDIPRITLEKYYNIFKTHENAAIIEPELRILQQALTAGVFWDEVVKIEVYTPADNNYVYDFTVPGNQTFMTESSVIVHNTLNSFTYETPIIVRNRTGIITEVPLGKFTEEFIEKATRKEYYEDKDTTYAELDEYYEVPSCGENGEITWEHIEAVTRHPVINADGSNTMLRVTTDEEREVVATKAKSFLKLVDGKVIGVNGSDLKVGDYLPVSNMPLEYTPQYELDLRELLPPTEYTYSSELEKAYQCCKAARESPIGTVGRSWWKNGNGVIFTLPYKNSDSVTAQMLKLERGEIKPFAPNCVYMANSRSKDDGNRPAIPEKIPLDYHFGYLAGAYAAEGCMTKYQISIANNDTEFYKPIIELCERWNVTTKQYRNENTIQEGWTSSDIRIYNKVLCRVLEQLCGKLSHNKFVLDKIIYSNRECILGFLDAYISGDGSISSTCSVISAGSVSKNLLEAVQKMLNTLGVYSFIKKSVKRTTTNRGTLPENIHQPYTLYVTGKQAKKLARLLHPTIGYKQESKIAMTARLCKYEISKKHEIIPNEIDGTVVYQSATNADGTRVYKNLLFNRIKSIEEVPNTTAYAYDLTVANTRNFNIANSLAGRDTFHNIGILSKTNATRGVPRIEEILSLSENIKSPSLTVYLKPEDRTMKNKAQEIMYRLEHTTLGELVKTTAVYFDPDDLNTLIAEDRDLLTQYKEFETMMDDCATVNLANNNATKSKWILRMEMDPEVMLEKNITMDDIHFTLNNIYKSQITCVYSDYNADKLVFRVRMNEVIKQNAAKSAVNKKPLNQYDQIYVLKNFQDNLMQNVVIRGIKNIRKVAMRKVKNMMIEHNGTYITQDQWVLDTTGTNLLETLALDYIDKYKTISNDIIEVYNVLGMEAARQTIYNEFVDVIKFDGTYIDYHHFCLLCDRMCYSNNLISIYRHGIKSDNIGPIAKASFEETPEMFLNAAKHGELDIMTGVSANVMCGQEGLYGTNAFEVLLDMNEMSKLTATAEYKKINKEKELEELFQAGKLAADADVCSVKNLAIQNGVVNIGSADMGTQNDDYNPF